MADLTINHVFVSEKLDGSDKSLVKPSNWNANLVYMGVLPPGFGGTGESTFLEDEAGAFLTDEAGVPLEGINPIDANRLTNTEPDIIRITFALSPFRVPYTTKETIIEADATGGNIIINLYPRVQGRTVLITKRDSSANTVTYVGNGSDTIGGQASRAISAQYNSVILKAGTTEWMRF